MDMLQPLGQGLKKVGTGLETFFTGAEGLEKLKVGITNAQTEQNIGKGPGNVPGAVMNRVGGALGGMLGLVPGVNAPQGRGGGYYGLKSLGESFVLPADRFLALQGSRRPQLQRGAFGEIVQHDPVSGRSQVVQPGRSEMMATSLGIFEQTPEGEFKPRVLPSAEAPEMPSLDDMMGMRFAQMEPEDQRRALMGRFGVDPYRLPTNMTFEQLASMEYRRQNPAGVQAALQMKQAFEAAEQTAKQTGADFSSLKTYENLSVHGLLTGNKELADLGLAYATALRQAGQAEKEPNQLSAMLFSQSKVVFDRILGYTGGRQMSAIPAFINETASGTLEIALDQALLDCQFPAESGGMSMPFNRRNPESFLLLQKTGLTEGGKLKAEITSENKEQYVRAKTIPESQQVVTIDAVTGRALTRTPSPTPTQATAPGSPSVATRWLEQQLYDLERAKTR